MTEIFLILLWVFTFPPIIYIWYQARKWKEKEKEKEREKDEESMES